MALALSEMIVRSSPDWLRDNRKRRRLASRIGIALAVAAPICAIVTYYLANADDPLGENSMALRFMIVVDFCLAIILLGIVAWRVAALVIARRARSAGSRLHLRMVRLFTIVAVAPALLLGLFAAITVTVTLDGWLNSRVAGVVDNSVRIAESLVEERHKTIRLDAIVVSGEIARASPFGEPTRRELAAALARASAARRLVEIYIINSSGQIIARGPSSFLFLYEAPDSRHFEQVKDDEVYVFEDQSSDSIRALMPLRGAFDAYLYLVRPVDGEAVRVLAETRVMAGEYAALEDQRSQLQLWFALFYIGFAVLVLSAAIWFGIWFADRLARPIGRLAGAADRVAKGDLTARVREEKGSDEIATLSRAFNRMTSQVERQRDALIGANSELDQRRRFTEAVLSGVSAGVIGFDPNGRVNLMNEAARESLLLDKEPASIDELARTLPGAAALLDEASLGFGGIAEARLVRTLDIDGDRDFFVRVACQKGLDGIEGFVMTLDDMTALVSAQRSAAWGDVARRVAHEIRNPLTPIQLSAERLKRKFAQQIEENRPSFEHCVDTIVRQVEQIRRMVEEFSNFARLPKPEFGQVKLDDVIRETVSLQKSAYPDIVFSRDLGAPKPLLLADRGLLSQVLTNLLRNAAQSVAERVEGDAVAGSAGRSAEVRVESRTGDAGEVILRVIDSGLGLPRRERERLTEPYVTTRKGGTGLGLAIVQRILDEHGATLELDNVEMNGEVFGATAIIAFPKEIQIETIDERAAAE